MHCKLTHQHCCYLMISLIAVLKFTYMIFFLFSWPKRFTSCSYLINIDPRFDRRGGLCSQCVLNIQRVFIHIPSNSRATLTSLLTTAVCCSDREPESFPNNWFKGCRRGFARHSATDSPSACCAHPSMFLTVLHLKFSGRSSCLCIRCISLHPV